MTCPSCAAVNEAGRKFCGECGARLAMACAGPPPGPPRGRARDPVQRHRGRAADADRATIRAGLAALAGSPDAARGGYRAALVAYRDLGLAWDEALVAQEAAWMLGVRDPEIAGWVDVARGTFTRLEAAPMLALLDQAVAGAGIVPGGPPAAAAVGAPALGESAGG